MTPVKHKIVRMCYFKIGILSDTGHKREREREATNSKACFTDNKKDAEENKLVRFGKNQNANKN